MARLGPPGWPAFPAPATFGALYERAPISAIAAARANAAAIALTLAEVGVSVAAAPLLDLRHAHTHGAIGDRSFGARALAVSALGRATLLGLADGGVVGVVKHLPGLGRAGIDSHAAVPVIDADAATLREDFAPFAALAPTARMGMTAHAIFAAFDAALPATLSPAVIGKVVRAMIGFDGLLMSDDIEMGALAGPVPDRAAAALAAGCDLVLHCSGDFAGMAAVVARIGAAPTEAARARLADAMAVPAPCTDVPVDALIARRDALLAAGG